MKKVAILLGITTLAGAAVYYFTKQYELVNSWDFKLVKVKIKGLSTQSSTLEVSMKITNPSNIEATVSNLNGSVTVNGVFVGNIYQTNVMAIPANGYNILTLNVQINNANTINQILSIGQKGYDAPINIRTEGTLKVKSGFIGVTIPVDDTENYTLGELMGGL